MAVNYLRAEDFPTFTGEESLPEKVDAMYAWMFQLREELTYILSQLTEENFNPVALKRLQEKLLASGGSIGAPGEDLNLVGNIYINGVLLEQGGETV